MTQGNNEKVFSEVYMDFQIYFRYLNHYLRSATVNRYNENHVDLGPNNRNLLPRKAKTLIQDIYACP